MRKVLTDIVEIPEGITTLLGDGSNDQFPDWESVVQYLLRQDKYSDNG